MQPLDLSLSISGCITFNSVGTLTLLVCNIFRYYWQYLKPVIASRFIRKIKLSKTTTPHQSLNRSKIQITNIIKINNINSIVWPAQSRYLHVIENICLRLVSELNNGNEIFMCKDQLEADILGIWTSITTEHV